MRTTRLVGLALGLGLGTGCARLSDEAWWFSELVPDSPCYDVNLLDGLDETSTAEVHDLFACVDQGGLIAPFEPFDADLELDTRNGEPAGVELARLVNHLPEVDVDPFALAGLLLDALTAEDRPVDDLLALATEALYGWRTPYVLTGERPWDDAESLRAGLLAPLRRVVPVAAETLYVDETDAVGFVADVLADPETEDWVRTVSSVAASTDPEVAGPLGPLLAHLGEAIAAARSPENDRWTDASGDSLRDVVAFFVVRDHPVVDAVSPSVAAMLEDPVVLGGLVPLIDELAAEDRLVPLGPQVGWLASVDTDGSPVEVDEPSALFRFVRLLAENNHPVSCGIDLGLVTIPWELPNLSVATLEIVADLTPGEVQSFSAIITSLTGNVIADAVFEVALDTCPGLTENTYDDLQALETLQQPETADVLVAFVALLNLLQDGERDHLPDFADTAQALYEVGGLEPGEELVRDLAFEPLLADVATLTPTLIHPEDHGITAGDAPANDLDDLLGVVAFAFSVDEDSGLTGFQRLVPWTAPVLGEDDTWRAVGNLGELLTSPDSRASTALDLIPVLVALDPDLLLLGQSAVVLSDEGVSRPVLRLAEMEPLCDDLLQDHPTEQSVEVPLAFGGWLIGTGAVEDLLRVVDLVLGSLD